MLLIFSLHLQHHLAWFFPTAIQHPRDQAEVPGVRPDQHKKLGVMASVQVIQVVGSKLKEGVSARLVRIESGKMRLYKTSLVGRIFCSRPLLVAASFRRRRCHRALTTSKNGASRVEKPVCHILAELPIRHLISRTRSLLTK